MCAIWSLLVFSMFVSFHDSFSLKCRATTTDQFVNVFFYDKRAITCEIPEAMAMKRQLDTKKHQVENNKIKCDFES